MNLEEIIDQYKALTIWHKYVKIAAAVLLAVMVGFVTWGIFNADLRIMLIVTGVVFGACGTGLYLAVHRLYIKTGVTFVDYLRASGMSDREIADLSAKYAVSFPETGKDKSGNG